MAEHNEIGKIGEEITRTFLMKHGFTVLEKNYRTRYGEIDIIAKKDTTLRFIEVKSVKVRDFETIVSLHVQPVDNLTHSKWSKLIVSIETYLHHKHSEDTPKWQVDLACVYVDTVRKQGLVKLLENIHKE